MSSAPQLEAWEEIEGLLERNDGERLSEFLHTLSPTEFARAMSRLDEEDSNLLFSLLDPAYAADLLEELSDIQGAGLLEGLPAERAAAIVDEMESGDRVDVLGELDSDRAEAILAHMTPEEATETRQMMAYDWDTAGGLMITEYLAYPETLNVEGVLNDLRKNRDLYADYGVQYVYVISKKGALVGVIRLRDLVLAPAKTALTDIMIRNPLCVNVQSGLSELSEFFDRHEFFGAPVVDDDNILLGVVQREDVEEALGERADETFLRASGIVGGEEIRTMPLGMRTRRRLAWLVPNIFLNLVAASVLMQYEETLDLIVALAIFLPMVSDMSGNSGNQAVAVSIRELTLGIIKPRDVLVVLNKELQVGVLNGFIVGALLGVVAAVYTGNLWFIAIVGGALALNTVLSVGVGGLIPLFFQRFKMDPALASGPILTTITDMCGFFIMLKLADLALELGYIVPTALQ